jgi:hypothetical protein
MLVERVDCYDAVLDYGVRTPAEFTAYLRRLLFAVGDAQKAQVDTDAERPEREG